MTADELAATDLMAGTITVDRLWEAPPLAELVEDACNHSSWLG